MKKIPLAGGTGGTYDEEKQTSLLRPHLGLNWSRDTLRAPSQRPNIVKLALSKMVPSDLHVLGPTSL